MAALAGVAAGVALVAVLAMPLRRFLAPLVPGRLVPRGRCVRTRTGGRIKRVRVVCVCVSGYAFGEGLGGLRLSRHALPAEGEATVG